MKTMLFALGATIALSATAWAQPVIISPTNGTTLYVGETNTIKWNVRPGSWSFVWIRMIDNAAPTNIMMINLNEPNNGSTTWTVGKFGTNTDFTIYVHDGGDDSNVTPIRVTIPNGPRPPKTASVPCTLKPMVSIEWLADTNQTYIVQSARNQVSWNTIIWQGKPATTNASVQVYQDTHGGEFFRVLQVLP
jgi:hypothetical protein